MNKKLIKASVAGAAAIALAAGGTTFASWSDFAVDPGNTVGADVLALTVNPSATRQFNDVKLAPGVGRDLAFYVASRNGVTIPKAGLTMTIKNLVGAENGCDSNSEAFAESNGAVSDANGAAPCNSTAGNEGQFIDQATYYVQADKVASAADCGNSASSSRQLNIKLSAAEDKVVDLLADGDSLAGGEGVCVLAHIFMNNNPGNGAVANNASQGDSATFDVRFDLTQLTS